MREGSDYVPCLFGLYFRAGYRFFEKIRHQLDDGGAGGIT